MTVDDVYKFILFVAKKNQAGGIRPDDFHSAYNSEQKVYFNDLLKLPQSEVVSQKLSPFKAYDQPITFVSGSVTKPAGVVKLESMRYNGKEVTCLESDKISSGLNSAIDPPDVNGMVYSIDAGAQYKIYPASIGTGVTIDFLVTPADVKWNHTEDGEGRYQYSEAGSVHPLWDDVSAIEIAGRALKSLGVSFEDSMLFAYGQQFKQQGS